MWKETKMCMTDIMNESRCCGRSSNQKLITLITNFIVNEYKKCKQVSLHWVHFTFWFIRVKPRITKNQCDRAALFNFHSEKLKCLWKSTRIIFFRFVSFSAACTGLGHRVNSWSREILTLSPRLSSATVRRKLISVTCICNLILLVTNPSSWPYVRFMIYHSTPEPDAEILKLLPLGDATLPRSTVGNPTISVWEPWLQI